MKQYEYRVQRDGEAEVVSRMPAVDEATARAELEALGFKVISIGEARGASSLAGTATQLELPLHEVLLVLAEEAQDKRLSTAARSIAAKLHKGATLEEAIGDAETQGPSYLAAVLRAITSGVDVTEVLDNFQRLHESARQTHRSLMGLMLYPLLMGLAMFGLATLFSGFLAPLFDNMFKEYALSLPPYTESILNSASYFPWVIGMALAGWLLISLMPSLVGLGFHLRSALPAVGRLYSYAAHEQFASTLASFLRLRVALPEALRHTGALLDDRSLGRSARRVSNMVERGEKLSDVLAGSRSFDRMLPIVAEWGERNAHLAATLDLAGEMFADRRRQRIQLLRSVVPPITLVLVATSAASVAGALLLPLLKLIEGLS